MVVELVWDLFQCELVKSLLSLIDKRICKGMCEKRQLGRTWFSCDLTNGTICFYGVVLAPLSFRPQFRSDRSADYGPFEIIYPDSWTPSCRRRIWSGGVSQNNLLSAEASTYGVWRGKRPYLYGDGVMLYGVSLPGCSNEAGWIKKK